MPDDPVRNRDRDKKDECADGVKAAQIYQSSLPFRREVITPQRRGFDPDRIFAAAVLSHRT